MFSRILHLGPDTCETCRFWQPDEDFDDNMLGECRLRAPKLHSVPADGPDPASLAAPPLRPWPMTESRDWCAEWRRGWVSTRSAPAA